MTEWRVNSEGRLNCALQKRSPNFNARPEGTEPILVVVHGISLPPREFGGRWIDDLFLNQLDCTAHPSFGDLEGLEVSAHFLIRRDGEIVQFVSCLDRAWHAGVSTWRTRDGCNDFSVGIELEGCDELPYTDVQYAAFNGLVAALRDAYPIVDVVGHSDIAPGRKTDPGLCFEWWRVEGPSRRFCPAL